MGAQAGEKVKAMKALLRSGDREKIVFFTGAATEWHSAALSPCSLSLCTGVGHHWQFPTESKRTPSLEVQELREHGADSSPMCAPGAAQQGGWPDGRKLLWTVTVNACDRM